jgi:hypothetical protein
MPAEGETGEGASETDGFDEAPEGADAADALEVADFAELGESSRDVFTEPSAAPDANDKPGSDDPNPRQ